MKASSCPLQADQDNYDSRRSDARFERKPDPRSPSYEDRSNERRTNDQFNDRAAARKSDVEPRHFNEKRSPGRFEADKPPRRSYDDRDGRRDERAHTEGTRDRPKADAQPFSLQYSEDNAPPIWSVKEILGDDIPTLRVDQKHSNGRSHNPTRSLPGSLPAPVRF